MAEEKRTLKTEVTAEVNTDNAQQNVTELQRLLDALAVSTAARKDELEGIKEQQDEIAEGAEAAEGAATYSPGQGPSSSDQPLSGGGIRNLQTALGGAIAKDAAFTRIFGISATAAAGSTAILGAVAMMPTVSRFGAAASQWLDEKGGLGGAAEFLTREAVDIGGNYLREGLEGAFGFAGEAFGTTGAFAVKATGFLPGRQDNLSFAKINEAVAFVRQTNRVGIFRDPEFDVALNKFTAASAIQIEDQFERLQNDIDAELGSMGFGAGVLQRLADYTRRTNTRIQDDKVLEADKRLRSDAEYYAEPSGQEDSD